MSYDPYDYMQKILDRIPPRWGRAINCGRGWYPLIAELDRALAEIDPNYEVNQIKEKFGGLRYYFTPSEGTTRAQADAMRALAHAAEARSFLVCEETGGPGVLMRKRDGYWLRTLDPNVFGNEFEIVSQEAT